MDNEKSIGLTLHTMSKEHKAKLVLESLEKDIVVYYYNYANNEVGYWDSKVRLWSFILMMYIMNKNINAEKLVEKLENIIKHPKILVVFMKSLKKIFYIWLKDYDLHCKLLMRLYPEAYSPKRLLILSNIKTREND